VEIKGEACLKSCPLIFQRDEDDGGCLGAVPSGEGKRTARNLSAVYCAIGDVSLGDVRFLGSCFVVRGFEGWRIAVCTLLLDVAVDTATSAFDVAVSL
jgi:hypothetical protein